MNERFIIVTICGYLRGLLRSYPLPSEGVIDIALILLGHRRRDLGEVLIEQVSPRKRINLIEELVESEGDMDAFKAVLTETLARSRRSIRSAFIRKVDHALSDRMKELARGGKSLIEKNVDAMAGMLKLTSQEREFLLFILIVTMKEYAENFFIDELDCHDFSRRHYLAALLGISRHDADGLFTGKMARLEMFETDRVGIRLSLDYYRFFQNPRVEISAGRLYGKLKGPILPLKDYLVEPVQIDHLVKLLSAASNFSTHVLLYGEAGTGKSTFARSIAREVGAEGYEIRHSSENRSMSRRAAIEAVCNMVEDSENALVVVDEADNLLNTQSSWIERGEIQDKGWLNHLMDRPGFRFIWIVNDIEGITHSVLRRFAYSILFRPFGRLQREHLWASILRNQKAGCKMKPEMVQELAESYGVTAGPMEMAVKKAKEMKLPAGLPFAEGVKRSLDAYETLVGDGGRRLGKELPQRHHTLEGLNIRGDLPALFRRLDAFASQIGRSQEGPGMVMNMLFYGPPGTGKSEMARYIARRLDRPLHAKLLSDLLNPYVGVTEKNIHRAFDAAARDEAVLVLDEADALLFGRDRAIHSWEISHTSEVLSQMERFSGILICTTNRVMGLDIASLRRFTQKISFDFLAAKGIRHFFKFFMKPLNDAPLSGELAARLERIECLAPGDFRVVRDLFRFEPPGSVSQESLVAALEEEARVKQEHAGRKPIGF